MCSCCDKAMLHMFLCSKGAGKGEEGELHVLSYSWKSRAVALVGALEMNLPQRIAYLLAKFLVMMLSMTSIQMNVCNVMHVPP